LAPVGTEKRERQKSNRALKYEQQVKEDRRSKTKRMLLRGGIFVVLGIAGVVAITLIAQSGNDDDGGQTAGTSSATTVESGSEVTAIGSFAFGSGECAPETRPDAPPAAFTEPPRLCIDPNATYTATLETSEGTIVVELATDTAPGTVNNFVNLARWGYYDDTTIFRAEQSIGIIQGGGTSMTDSIGYHIPDEGAGFTYKAGQLVMARDNVGGGAQWFINANDDASALDAQGTYVVFGTVTEGLDVAEQILALSSGDENGTLTREVALTSVTITEG
jgi:cyclophilin family peptidyl-prolyl cis-trans isomerase